MSIVCIQYSDHGIRFVSDSRWTKIFSDEYEDRTDVKKITRLGAVVFSATGMIAAIEHPPLPLLTVGQGETILYRLSRLMCVKLDLSKAAKFQELMGAIHTCFLAGQDPKGQYWLRGLQVTFENGQFTRKLLKFPCGPIPKLCSSGGRAVPLDVDGDPVEHIKAVIALGGDCGGPIQEVTL